ncbi:uncharacterized protein PAC_02006 [Phialocephala subalpina]|uniref:Uncharacterized protein n=1 Tax=Phialocephala subalpina TaxID=576137 RepID=A0A1L7WH79_9HELO|nr:uncharacterized protein PAC_02006 [Phialocephala subalpina]
MAINCALLLVILFGYGFVQSDTAESCTRLQAEATVEIQYDGQVGSGIILMTSNPTSCANLVSSNSSGTLSNSITTTLTLPTTTSSKTSLTSATPFNTPPSFGVSRTQMINATSTGQHRFPTTIGSSQMVTGATATQSLPEHSTSSTPQSVVAGSGTRPDVSWSHVAFWAVVTELVTGFL